MTGTGSSASRGTPVNAGTQAVAIRGGRANAFRRSYTSPTRSYGFKVRVRSLAMLAFLTRLSRIWLCMCNYKYLYNHCANSP